MRAARSAPSDAVALALQGLALLVAVATSRARAEVRRVRAALVGAAAGALAIYLQLGLIFAWVVGLDSHLDSAPYFAQGGDGSQADRVYFSFTVLTITGFGDLTPAQPVGRAVAVVEMLSGQLYLVTVIGVLVGGLVARRRG